MEEHQVYGGMGSAVAEFLATAHPTSITFIGVQDQFGQSGTPDELIEHYGMGIASIKKAVKAAIKRSNLILSAVDECVDFYIDI